MRHATLLSLVATSALLTIPARADDLGGGKAGSHGRIPRFVLESWIPGQPSAFRFVDLPRGAIGAVAILSDRAGSLRIPGLGTLVVDIARPGAAFIPIQTSLVIPKLPLALQGVSLVYQGLYLDARKLLLTNGTRADVFTPTVMVGNQRQSANSLSVIDASTRRVVQRLTNSENGYVTYSADRKFAFVCEPGSQRNRIVAYDLRRKPIRVAGTVSVSGGIRYGCAVTRDGKRLYAPLHNGISVIDSDPASAKFLTELRKIPTKITGNPGTIFTGPLDLAVTPDGRKLYIAYGERLAFPAKSHVGVIDLTQSSTPEKLIPITTGGTFRITPTLEFATHQRIKMGPMGRYVYLGEWGVDPAVLGSRFVRGFTNGALVTVILVPLDRQFRTIATGGFQASELAVDRLGRNVWVAQIGRGQVGQALRIDIDAQSNKRWSIAATVQVDPTPYRTGAGPLGIDVTPDGATVFVSVAEDRGHPTPQVVTIDARTNKLFGRPIRVESLPATLRVQQR